ncbi:DMT family transporter [Sulfitobacter sabulilitoris]|uniref:DMT family transporter n=1 Tax=Sulfitobacter sabulilitoris TaxID=2562655 RepID=A0A5S3QAZ1_9RHOB|nr:DMT family transporter [Sulfitobacter sabulilitoris]TMM54272.1 DMT family transporter [Sulfitobacter sabulilitoris]
MTLTPTPPTVAPPPPRPIPAAPTGAIALMIGAVLCFSGMDASVKAVTPELGTLPALWARYAGQMLFVLVLVAPRLRQVAQTRYLPLHLGRSVLLMSATFFFFSGLAHIELAEAAAVMNINPMLIALGATLFLGEPMGRRRLIAIAVALVGALLIIRPGTGAFTPAALLPLAAAICFAAYTLLTRRVGADEDVWTSLFYTGLVGSLLLSVAIPFVWVAPGPREAVQMAMIAGFGTLGQLLLIRALSAAQAGLLAPFNYLGLVFATLWGVSFFGEVPDALTLLGALVIAATGLYVWHRERQRR